MGKTPKRHYKITVDNKSVAHFQSASPERSKALLLAYEEAVDVDADLWVYAGTSYAEEWLGFKHWEKVTR